MSKGKSLQELYSPNSACVGCGVKNKRGLRLRSFLENNELVAEWNAKPHHEAFPGILNGGIIGTLLDCHSNWAAAYYLLKKDHKTKPDCVVTAEYAVTLLRPTPTNLPINLIARVVESTGRRVTVEAELIVNDKVCATCRGIFVAVKEDHPAANK